MRLIFIIGALVSLCISDNVGPRLLPLPSSQVITLAVQSRLGSGSAATRIPAPTQGSSPRVEMAVTPQYRAGDRHQQVLPATHAPQVGLEPPVNILQEAPNNYRPLFSLVALVSVPAGRAPPRLV